MIASEAWKSEATNRRKMKQTGREKVSGTVQISKSSEWLCENKQ
jgi:hypothetical protein